MWFCRARAIRPWISKHGSRILLSMRLLRSRLALLGTACALPLFVALTPGCASTDSDTGDDDYRGCTADSCVKKFPFTESPAESAFTRPSPGVYTCGDTRDHAGSARLYQVDLPSDGLFAAEVPAAYDVYITRKNDLSECVRGGSGQVATWLAKGRYFVSVAGRKATARPEGTVSFGLTTTQALGRAGMPEDTARSGLQAFSVAFGKGDTKRLIYAMTDFGLPSDRKRQWVVDLRTSEVLYNLYIAHGEASSSPTDKRMAVSFSNVNNSKKTSLGMMRSAETYTGDFGYSYRLDGLERGFNDKARPRAIVVHPWYGSQAEFVARSQSVAPTWGCPAVDNKLPKAFFDTMSGGVLHWYSAQDGDWSRRTTYKL